MSENSPDNVSSRLEKHKREKAQSEANFKQSIDESVKNASSDWSNALLKVVNQMDDLAKSLVTQSLELNSEQIAKAQLQMVLLQQQLTQMIQTLSQMPEQISEKVTQTTQSVNDSLDTMISAVSKKSIQVTEQAKHHLDTIPNQMQSISDQAVQHTRKITQAHQHKMQQLNKIGFKASMLTALEIFLAIALFAGNYYLGKQVYHTQQTLDILQQHIDQTPTETKALAMVNIFENKGKEGGVLITPKNQQTAFWGENQNKEKTLLVTAPESLPQLQQTPKRK
jgi:hypothetical protein